MLTREQIDALSEDPDEARRQLEALAGPGATIRVDSFEGAPLPPKSQIRMIRISRDQFAAENHSAGGLLIEIVSQPGIGPLRGTLNMRLRDGSMSARSPLVERKDVHAERLDIPPYRREWCHQLVGHISEQLTARVIGLL